MSVYCTSLKRSSNKPVTFDASKKKPSKLRPPPRIPQTTQTVPIPSCCSALLPRVRYRHRPMTKM